MGVDGNRGAIIREHATLTSSDGGQSWRVSSNRLSVDVLSAWLTPSLHLLRLSAESLFVSQAPDAASTVISLKEENVSYLAAAAPETLQQIFLVGGRSVSTTKQEMEELPQYARDPTTAEPRMIIPMIAVSYDHGKNWQTINLEKAVGYLDGIEVAGSNRLAWGPYAVYSSADSGKSWKMMKIDLPNQEEESYPVAAVIVDDKAYVSLKSGRFLAGRIGGPSLKPLSRQPSAIGQLTFINACTGFGVAPSPTESEDVLMETNDGGETWAPIYRSKAIVALTSSGFEVFGATQNRAFRFRLAAGESGGRCNS